MWPGDGERARLNAFAFGRGKLQELVSLAYHEDADLLIFDRELNPAQAREIEEETKLKVVDRTQLILDIFAQNARGREAQLQVELAQLERRTARGGRKQQEIPRNQTQHRAPGRSSQP